MREFVRDVARLPSWTVCVVVHDTAPVATEHCHSRNRGARESSQSTECFGGILCKRTQWDKGNQKVRRELPGVERGLRREAELGPDLAGDLIRIFFETAAE
jgi:hypothetical protein